MNYLIILLTITLLLSLQTTFIAILFPSSIVPDLVLITAVYCGIHLKGNTGIWLAVLFGFVQDCLSGGLLGVNSLSKGLAGLFFCFIKDKIIVQGIIHIGFFIFATSLVDGMIYFLAMTSLLGGQIKGNFLFSFIILFGVYNAVIAPFLFYMFDQARQWLHRKFPAQVFESI